MNKTQSKQQTSIDALTNVPLERKVIASLMQCSLHQFHAAIEGLAADCFTTKEHHICYNLLTITANKGGELCDIFGLMQSFYDSFDTSKEDANYIQGVLAELVTDSGASLVSLKDHIAILIDLHARREGVAAANAALSQIMEFSTPFDSACTMASEKMRLAASGAYHHTITGKDVVSELYDRINKNLKGNEKGIQTGFSRFDYYGGLHQSDLVIIAADSSQGKTSLATTMAYNAASSGVGVAFYSMEMTRVQIVARMASMASGVSGRDILYKPLGNDSLSIVDGGVRKMEYALEHLFFDDNSINGLDAILGSIRTMSIKHGVSMAVVDYLQIINLDTKGVTQERAVASAARQFKNIAKELGICIVVLSQINRDNAGNGNREPTKERLRDSGQINEAADMTLLVYRPESYVGECLRYPKPHQDADTHNTAMLKVAKDRNGAYGGVGSFIVGFSPSTTHFFDLNTIPTFQPSHTTGGGTPFDNAPF